MVARSDGTSLGAGELGKRGGLAIGLSLAVNLLVLQGVLASGFVEPFDALSVPPVAFLTAVGAIGATVVYGLLWRYADRPDRTFVVVAAVVLVASFVPDVALLELDPAATVPAVLALMVMHATVAVICVVALTDTLGVFR